MAGPNPLEQEVTRPDKLARGSQVVDVDYKFPHNGWTVKQIAPLPPESQITMPDGSVITHIVRGGPHLLRDDMISGVTQQRADDILSVARGEKESPRYVHSHH